MPYGYHGKVLHVDLTQRQWHVETPPESFYRTYMGGSGFATYYLLKEMPAGVDPLGPDNVLVFALSVLTGVPIHGNSRATAAARSPLTGAVGDAQAGGFWPAVLCWKVGPLFTISLLLLKIGCWPKPALVPLALAIKSPGWKGW